MVVFQRCNQSERKPNEPDCAGWEEVDAALYGSYIVLVENKEIYLHQESPSSGNVIQRNTHISWYALSLFYPVDFYKKLSQAMIKY